MEINEKLTIHLLENNPPAYNITKCLEEMAELNEKLLKFINKKPEYKPKLEEITEEIGDVFVRLEVLARQFSEKAVQKRIEVKSEKLLKYVEKGEYKGGL